MTTVQELAASIIAEHPFQARPPWSPHDDAAIDVELRRLVAGLSDSLTLECRAEFDHYGSGYASFVDAWFFRRYESFRKAPVREHYTGLVVLLCRLAPFFCLMEGEKAWDAKGGSSYLPAFDAVDSLTTKAVQDLAQDVEHQLLAGGYVRLTRGALDTFLPPGTAIPTILTDPPYRYFDALFHWED